MATSTSNLPGQSLGQLPGQDHAIALDLAADRMDRAIYRRRRRKLWLLLLPLAGLLLGLAFLVTRPKIYEATGQIQLVAAPIRGSQTFRRYAVDKRAYGNEVEVLTSQRFYAHVADRLDPAHNPIFRKSRDRKGGRKSAGDARPPGDPRAEAIAMLAGGLRAKTVPMSGLLEISFRGTDPVFSATVVNAAMDASLLLGFDAEAERLARTANFFTSRLDTLQQEIEQDEAKEDAVDRSAGLSTLDLESKDTAPGSFRRRLSRRELKHARRKGALLAGANEKFDFKVETDPGLASLAHAATMAALDRRLAVARLQLSHSLAAQGGDLLEDGAGKLHELEDLRLHLANSQAEYAALEAEMGPEQPSAKALLGQISEIRQEIEAEQRKRLENRQQAVTLAEGSQKQIDAALRAKKKDAEREFDAELKNAGVELELALDLTIYQDLEERLEQVRYSSNGGPIAVNIVNRAEVPTRPVRGSVLFILLASGGGMLLLAVLGIVLLFATEVRLWSVVEVEEATGVEAVAIVPESSSLGERRGSPLAALPALPGDLGAALFGGLDWPKRVLFTSATPGEGKTTCCTSFAVALAQRGRRVLVLDCDLHRPTVSRRLGLDRRLGMSQVLSGHATLAEALQPVSAVPGLYAVTAGALPPRPSELIGSPALEALLDEAQRDFDFILLDAPPLLVNTDGLMAGAVVDAVVMVARFGKVTTRAIAGATRLADRAGTPLAGVVVNAVPPRLLLDRTRR